MIRIQPKPKKQRKIFYVYEHWRPDRDICFWVGKGHGNRARNFVRNVYYNSVVAKLTRLGMCVEVRMVQCGLIEADAFILEKERIAFWKSAGFKLANLTDGGEGPCGIIFTEETKAKLRAKRALRIITEETKLKLSRSRTGMKFSMDHRKKLSKKKIGKKRKPFTE